LNFKLEWNRRSFLNGLGGLAGLLAGGAGLDAKAPAKAGTEATRKVLTGFGASGQVYEELGVKPVINAIGTMTFLGGSLISPEVVEVMDAASKHFVNIIDLSHAAGKRISQMLKLPEGYSALVTSGAAGALVCGYAGILTGDNPDFIQRIPDLTGMKTEVLIQKSHRYPFDHQIRQTGVKLVEVETREEAEKAIGPQTAAMHFTNLFNQRGRIKVDEWLKIAKSHNIPAFNDAAADTPPISRLWEYTNMGYDLVAFSGGKDIRGPQCAGLLLGRSNLVEYALMNTNPNEDTIGRPSKVGKEEICGMVKALELFLASDQEAALRQYWKQLDYIAAQTSKIPGVSAAYHYDPHQIANHTVSMQVSWDPRKISLSGSAVAHELRNGNPCIYVGGGGSEEGGANTNVHITAWMLKPGEEKIIAERLSEVLRSGLIKA
jgi:L-seryl-tRNA(Ser) seleniumtransferase